MPDMHPSDDTTFIPTSPLKSFKELLIVMALLFPTLFFIFSTGYVIVCYMDQKSPMEINSFTATDTYLGGKFNIRMEGRRIRQCRINVYHQAVDSKGTVIYEKVIDRPTNGVADQKVDAPYYDIPLNDRARVAGPAKMFIYFDWICPYNVVQEYIHPLQKTIVADFYIYETKEEWETAQAKKNKERSR